MPDAPASEHPEGVKTDTPMIALRTYEYEFSDVEKIGRASPVWLTDDLRPFICPESFGPQAGGMSTLEHKFPSVDF